MYNKLFFTALFLFLSSQGLFSQVTMGSTVPPVSGALLDLKQKSTTGGEANSTLGVNLPRVSLIAIDQLEPCAETSTANNKAHAGLVVYNTTDNSETDNTLAPGIYYWDGAHWRAGMRVISRGYGPWYQVDDPTLPSYEVTTDSYLNAKAVVGGANVINDATLSVHGGVNITGDEALGGSLDVVGATTLNSTTINVGSAGKALIIEDGSSSKSGKYLKAMDNSGHAEWQSLGTISTSSPVSFKSGGITYDAVNPTGDIDTGASISLPPGTWMIQCAFLFYNPLYGTSPGTYNTSNDSHWARVTLKKEDGTALTFAGASLVSGNIQKRFKYNMISGYMIVKNGSSSSITCKFTLSANREGAPWTTLPITAFASGNAENAVVAFQLTE